MARSNPIPGEVNLIGSGPVGAYVQSCCKKQEDEAASRNEEQAAKYPHDILRLDFLSLNGLIF
jgi:hypothetical protein